MVSAKKPKSKPAVKKYCGNCRSVKTCSVTRASCSLWRSPTHPSDVEEFLEVRWNSMKDFDIHWKRFRRMGALLKWVEQNKDLCMSGVGLVVHRRFATEETK